MYQSVPWWSLAAIERNGWIQLRQDAPQRAAVPLAHDRDSVADRQGGSCFADGHAVPQLPHAQSRGGTPGRSAVAGYVAIRVLVRGVHRAGIGVVGFERDPPAA